MKFKHFLIANICLVLSSNVLAATVTAVRSWRAPDNTRIVLDLSETVRFRQLTPFNKQLVIELDNTDIAVSNLSLPAHIGLLQSMQFQAEANKQRLIINLSDDVRPHVFLLPANETYKPRLVIDLFDKVTMEATVPVEDDVLSNESNKGRSVIVAVDAGHGGEDSGAIGASGHYEKFVTLAIAKKLVAALRNTDGFKAYLTRDGDYFIPLQDRRKIARNRYKADIFISIHADAALSPLAKGASVFALSRKGATTATSRFAQVLAENENKSDLIGGVDNTTTSRDSQLTNILADMVVEGSLTQSLHMGNHILGELKDISPLHSRHVEQAGFAVLKEPGMISVLVETGFISNPNEEAKLTDPDEQQKIAQSVLSGVKAFLEKYPMPKTHFAWRKEQRSGKQKARAMREVVAIPEPKITAMTADKLLDVPVKSKIETLMPTLVAKEETKPLIAKAADIKPTVPITDKLRASENKALVTSSSTITTVVATKHSSVAATLPSSLDDFMAGVPKSSTSTSTSKVITKDKKNDAKSTDTAVTVTSRTKIPTESKVEPKKPLTNEQPIKHKVVQGDSLSSIALKYHLDMDDLKAWNHLQSDNALLGTTLRLTAPDAIKQREKDGAKQQGDALKNVINSKENKTKTPVKIRTHVVKVGDSLSDLAVQYGVSKQAIRDANKLKDDNVLLDQTLKIPTP